MKKIIYTIALFILFYIVSLFACTSFVLSGRYPYLAKNLDWEIDRGYMLFNLDGVDKTSITDPSLSWTSSYKSITNNQFGKEFPLGGMNEAGLVIEEMSLFGQPYAVDNSKQRLNEFQWVQYQLDISASVNEVINSFENITISHSIMNLHYLITDKSGDVAVIECLENGVNILHDDELQYKALSNNKYAEALRYLRFFEGYGGDMKIQHRPGSQERFVSAVYMLDKYVDTIDRFEYCFDILNTVKQEDTRWQFVYNTKDLRVEYKSHGISGRSSIGFDDLKNIKHNKFAITLFGGKHRQIKMNARMNEEHLKIIQNKLETYFSGKEHIYDQMVEEGERSLRAK
jgi:penicillin V acylase-like amidase (Ntn superfamily)